MATFVTAAGGRAPNPGDRQEREGRKAKDGPIYDSVNLIPFFKGTQAGDPHEALIWRMALRGAAIRVGDWKFLQPASQLPQLYNLAEDVGETRNLLGAEPERASELLAQLNKWETTLERNPMFISDSYWAGYNQRLYARQHSLVQPGPDDDEDIWSFGWKGR
jgi:arylsulfatase A-like enzyme